MKSVLFAVIVLLLASCSGSTTDPCPDDIASYSRDFDVTGIAEIRVSDMDGNIITDETTPISIDQLVLNVELAYVDTNADTALFKKDFGSMVAGFLIKPAYACSPRGHRLTSKVVGLSLISNASLGDGYPPGASLDGVFSAVALSASFLGTDSTEVLDQISVENPLADSTSIVIRSLIGSIETSALHRFTLTVDIENGQRFSQDTVAISIPGG